MPAVRTCSECGQPLHGAASEALCPVCALRSVAEDDRELDLANEANGVLAEGERGHRTSPPAAAFEEQDASADIPGSLALNRSLGDYELIEELARGGMGVVFRARQKSLDRIVALKLVIGGPVASAAALQRFQAEAQAAAGLQHPNIVAIHEVGEHEGQAYFSMDYIEGRDLAQVLRDGPLPPRQAAGYVKDIAEAIAYAHQRGILHRYLKPSNVLIDQFNRPRITDFGLAKKLSGDSELTVSGQVLGSPNFMAPEQALGASDELGPWSDVYSIGALLYHLVTGRPPFQAATLTEVLRQVVANAPAAPRLLNASLPVDVETICLKCLEKEPGRRYPTAQALADELGRFLGGQPILARPIGPVGKTWRWCRRNPRLTAALGAVALSLVLGFAGISWALRGERIQRERAEAGELSARQNAYVLAMNGAQQALNAGNQARALELLNLYAPARDSETDFRGFEWRYLWQECQNEAEAVVGRMGSRIRCLEVSPDGRWLVAGSELAGITLWDLVTGEQIQLVSEAGVKGGVKGFAAFSPDSSILACTDQTLSSVMGKISIWETQTRRFQPPITNAWCVGPMCFSSDGRLFGYGIAGYRFERAAVILDFAARKQIAWIVLRTGVTSSVHGLELAFTADGKSMVFSENPPDLRLGLWTFLGDPSTNYFPAHKEAIAAIAISPDGKSLATAAGYSETTIKLWQVPSFRPLGDLSGHQAWVAGLKFSPDGKTLASAGTDKTIRLWDVAERTLRRVFQRLPLPVYRVCFSPDGRRLFSGDGAGDIYRWSIDAPVAHAACRTVAERLDVVTVAPNGRQFAGVRDGTVCLGTTEDAAPPQVLTDLGTNNLTLLFSSDGASLFAGTQAGEVRIWSLDRRETQTRLPIRGAPVTWLGQSRDGRTLVVGQWWNREVREGSKCGVGVWNPASGEEVKSWTFSARVPCLAVSPDGHWVATGHLEGPVQICRLTDQSSPHTLNFSGRIRGVAFSPDGKLLAACSGEGMVEVWDLPHLRESPPFRAHTGEVYALAFSPDSRRLATASYGEEALKVWDVATWKELITLERPDQGLQQIAFSDDGRQLIGRDLQGNLLVWRAPSFAEIDAQEKTRGFE